MQVEELMTREVLTLVTGQTLRDAWETIRIHRIRQMPVMEEGKLVGIVTDRDVRRALPSLFFQRNEVEFDRVLDETKVESFMTREPLTIGPRDPVRKAVDIMIERKIGGLPVVDGNSLVGIISETDLLRLLQRILPEDDR